ncbi:MAG: hypothetical protein JXB32_15655, partial [Deltaproteobacteria bacterium]|nr:hypothetical protein [Deltaproteobacteria bacterium]
LRPDGRLMLETPDPRASFRSFLAARTAWSRAERLTWIFGHEQPGGGHRILLPPELLRGMLRNAGFDRVRFERPRTHRHRDGLRVVARRADDPAARLLAGLRALAARTLPPPAGHLEALEIEHVLAKAAARTARHRNVRSLERTAFDLLRLSPALVPGWLAAAGRLGLPVPRPVERRLVSLARRAGRSRFPGALWDLFRHRTMHPRERPADGFELVLRAAATVLRTAEADPCLDPTRELRRRNGRFPRSDVAALPFTRDGAQREIDGLRNRAIRDLGAGRPQDVLTPLRRAICSGLCDLHTVWNMAVAQALLGRLAPADDYYAAALRFGGLPPAVRRTLRLERAVCRLHAGDPDGAATLVRGLRAPDTATARRLAAVRHAAHALHRGRAPVLPPLRRAAVRAGEGFHAA